VKRGEIWTQSGGPGYAGKPRPALIVQSDLLEGTDSVITCLFTSQEPDDGDEIPSRVPIEPTATNGLLKASSLMADKVMAVPRSKLGQRVGILTADDLDRVEYALVIALGLAG
jgi:mRNA interferase MazF